MNMDPRPYTNQYILNPKDSSSCSSKSELNELTSVIVEMQWLSDQDIEAVPSVRATLSTRSAAVEPPLLPDLL